MSRIHIDKIIATGEKGTSVIEFATNLTIIKGKSETGKTSIYKCIDYLFGAKADDEHRPFLPSTGYDTVVGEFSTDEGKFTLKRKIDSKSITVESEINGIDCEKPYNCTPSHARWIGYLWQNILGVPEKFQIPWSKDGKMKSFSWRSINQAFMISEERSEKMRSAILAKDVQNETAFLSELLYILYRQDLTEYDAREGTKLRQIRRAAVQKYITSKRDAIKARLESLTEKQPDQIDIDAIIADIRKKLDEINRTLQNAISENQSISAEIISYQENQSRLKVTLQRFDVLESQYAADIKRLGLIVDGETTRSSLTLTRRCPFCDGRIETRPTQSYIQASKGELTKTINNAHELSEAKNDILEELKICEEQLRAANRKKNEIEKLMTEKLLPEQTSLEKQLKEYQALIEYNKTVALFEEMDTTYETDYKANDKSADSVNYHPREILKEHDEFAVFLTQFYRSILSETKFHPIETVEFDFKTFDMKVNDNPKSNRSKGFKSYFNSCLVLALREYINKVAAINPHFYLLDSPLHGLKTTLDDEVSADDLRRGFFEYVFKNYGDDQIVIIENTDKYDLPAFEYDDKKVKIYTFTKDTKTGRYGFLNGVFQN